MKRDIVETPNQIALSLIDGYKKECLFIGEQSGGDGSPSRYVLMFRDYKVSWQSIDDVLTVPDEDFSNFETLEEIIKIEHERGFSVFKFDSYKELSDWALEFR